MVAIAAFPTPGAGAAGPFAAKSHNHPPYKDMILSAINALKERKGSSRRAISKYIADNFSDLPAGHDALLGYHLRRLRSEGVLSMVKFSYMLGKSPAAGITNGTRKRGRPRKTTNARPGRRRKVSAETAEVRKKKPGRPLKTTAMSPSAVYFLPQSEHLKSGLLPGTPAIVLPQGLVNGIVNLQREDDSVNPVLILPNGLESLVDVSGKRNQYIKKKKPGRPRKMEVKQAGQPRKKIKVLKQVGSVPIIGKSTKSIAKSPGRPRKTGNLSNGLQFLVDVSGKRNRDTRKKPGRPRKMEMKQAGQPRIKRQKHDGSVSIVGNSVNSVAKRPGRPQKTWNLLNGLQSLVDAFGKRAQDIKKKPGRPRKMDVKQVGQPRKNIKVQKHGGSVPTAGKSTNSVSKRTGRPLKTGYLGPSKNAMAVLANNETIWHSGGVQGMSGFTGLDVKKRPVGRPRKRLLVGGSNLPPNFIELGLSETAEELTTLNNRKAIVVNMNLDVKKRPVGRPKKTPISQGLEHPPVISSEHEMFVAASSEVKKRSVGRPRRRPEDKSSYPVSHAIISDQGILKGAKSLYVKKRPVGPQSKSP